MELKGSVSLEMMDAFLPAQVKKIIPRGGKGTFRLRGASPMQPPTWHQPKCRPPHTGRAWWPSACCPASGGGLTERCPGDPASHQLLFPCGMISALTILFLPPPESSLLLPCNASPLAQITY